MQNALDIETRSYMPAGGLDLYTCSEHVKMESLAGEHRLGSESQAKTSLLVKYAKRDKTLRKMNLIEYFDHYHNKSSHYAKNVVKTKIPLFTGARCEPVYPVTESYARGVLLIYHPWHGHLSSDNDSKDQECEFVSESSTPWL
jgi:hypothetical protein